MATKGPTAAAASGHPDYQGPKPIDIRVTSGGGQFQPGMAGNFGVFPGYLGHLFPEPETVTWKGGKFKAKPAPYNYIDPMEYASAYGALNRREFGKNFGLAQNFALDTLDTELRGLQGYVPAAAALKRDMLSVDNEFNQDQRTKQIDKVLPGMRSNLRGQTDRALAFAEGRVPSSIDDRALELGVRSASADASAAGGFGAGSSVARKASDQMSSAQRIQLSQYGDQLLSSNATLRANLELAPTQYSDAGAQVKVNPSISASQLATNFGSALNEATMLPIASALSTAVNQEQFMTNTKNTLRMFNKGNRLSTEKFNAQTKNNFATALFGYQATYAGAVAGAHQTNINTEVALAQQAQAQQAYQQAMAQTQAANEAGAVSGGIGAAVAALPSIIESVGGVLQSTGITGNSNGGNEQPQSQPIQQPQLPAVTNLPPGGVIAPSVESVPDGYTPVASSPTGEGHVSAIPTQTVNSMTHSFTDTIQSRALSANSETTRALLTANAVTMEAAGMSYVPRPGDVQLGYNNTGQPVYANASIVQDTNVAAGSEFITDVMQAVNPFGVFSEDDVSSLQQVTDAARDTAFIASLDQMASRGDNRAFINAVVGRVGPGVVGEISDDPQNIAGAGAAFAAHNAFQSWNHMSPAQKSMALGSIGIQSWNFSTGENLATKIIPATAGTAVPVTVGEAMGIAGQGINVHSFINNYDQMNDIQRILGGTQTAAGMAQTANSMGLIGVGQQGAAVAVDAAQLVNAGYTSAGHLGVGAVYAPGQAAIPAGYTAIPTAQGTAAIPTAHLGTTGVKDATTAGAGSIGQTAATVAGVASIASGAYTLYKGWGTGGSAGRVNGAIGGAMMAAGLYTMGAVAGPIGIAAVVAASVLAGSIKTGKHEDQIKRDGVRSMWKENGLVDDNWSVTLADGTKASIGLDGKSGRHTAKNQSKLVESARDGASELNAYDVDYTNDLDYFAGMGGISLSRLIAGGKAQEIDQMGGQLGNAMLANISEGREFTYENFDKTMTNMRGQYAKAGIKTKQDAYQLANLAYAEGRINETDLVSMHQSFNMMYDKDGFDTAKKLADGRWEGVKVAAGKEDPYRVPDNTPAMMYYKEQRDKYPQFFENPALHGASSIDPGYVRASEGVSDMVQRTDNVKGARYDGLFDASQFSQVAA